MAYYQGAAPQFTAQAPTRQQPVFHAAPQYQAAPAATRSQMPALPQQLQQLPQQLHLPQQLQQLPQQLHLPQQQQIPQQLPQQFQQQLQSVPSMVAVPQQFQQQAQSMVNQVEQAVSQPGAITATAVSKKRKKSKQAKKSGCC